ncbi:hypothetical protein BV898_20118 [Hypsibius exemplaris]|nr:hypothetical protein BV898_20118 [Hypsibius exemplaris]
MQLRQLDRAEMPPPSYEQLYRADVLPIRLTPSVEAAHNQRPNSAAASAATSASGLGSVILGPSQPNDISLGVIGRDSTWELLPNRT